MILTKYSSFSTIVMRKPMLTYMELPTINRQLLLVPIIMITMVVFLLFLLVL